MLSQEAQMGGKRRRRKCLPQDWRPQAVQVQGTEVGTWAAAHSSIQEGCSRALP